MQTQTSYIIYIGCLCVQTLINIYILTLQVDVGRVAMAGRYAEIGKTLSVICVQCSQRHSCFEKCVSISKVTHLLSFAKPPQASGKTFLRISLLLVLVISNFYEDLCFYHRLLIQYFKIRIKAATQLLLDCCCWICSAFIWNC